MKPTYEDLANAFAEFVACCSNDGDPVQPSDEEVARAQTVVDAAGGSY